jgi:hypothetical protein
MHNDKLFIHVISDSIGEAARQISQIAIEHFKGVPYRMKRYSYVRTKERAEMILTESKRIGAVVVLATLNEDLHRFVMETCQREEIVVIDLLSSIVEKLEPVVGQKPVEESREVKMIERENMNRIEALEFAISYDDGKNPSGILEADVVLIGVSRSSKTPLSMYLAFQNLRVANVPLARELRIPDELYKVPPEKIFGLSIDPEELSAVRTERLKELGLGSNVSYADSNRILEELEFAEEVMRSLNCRMISVSNRAIEETANDIIQKISKN